MKFQNFWLLEFVYLLQQVSTLFALFALCFQWQGKRFLLRCASNASVHPFFWRPFGSKRLNSCFKMFPRVIGSTMVLGLEFGKADCLDLWIEVPTEFCVFEAITCSTPERQWPHYLIPALKWRLAETTRRRNDMFSRAMPCQTGARQTGQATLSSGYGGVAEMLVCDDVMHGFAWQI